MNTERLTPSSLDPAEAIYRRIIEAGDHWSHEIKQGQVFRIVDLEGNQAADTLFYDAHDPANRYSACDTIQRQAALYLSTGTRLVSTQGDELLTIMADTCGRHDTLGGACSRESNTMRYAAEKANTEPQFILHPATWLNGDRWEDEPSKGHSNGARPRTLADAADDLIARTEGFEIAGGPVIEHEPE